MTTTRLGRLLQWPQFLYADVLWEECNLGHIVPPTITITHDSDCMLAFALEYVVCFPQVAKYNDAAGLQFPISTIFSIISNVLMKFISNFLLGH